MRKKQVYKSPASALLWCLVFPGLGQLYNRDYILGFLLIGLEFIINIYSNLNLAILYSFSGEFIQAHDVINYQWGLFYPSIYAFAMWQAYNHAKAINFNLDNKTVLKKSYFTGPLIGLVIGMDLGLFWHDHKLFAQVPLLGFMDYPVFNGLILGLVGVLIGAIIDKLVRNRKNRKKRLQEKELCDC